MVEKSTRYPEDAIRESVERYKGGGVSRRDFLQSLTVLLGSYSAAHLFLESSGLAATLISASEAQTANIATETVRYSSGDIQIEAYLAKPQGRGKHAAVLVIHENRGLNEHIRDVVRRFAMEGFVALAPDLLSRAGGTGKMASVADATEAVGMLPINEVVGDLKAGYSYLARHVEVDAEKISSVGFCWGGWRSFILAMEESGLHRAVVFYGSTPDSGFERIRAPVLAHYAEWDYNITGNRLWTEEKMNEARKQFQYYVYPETDHAFFNDTGPRHNLLASQVAWRRTLEFLRT